MGSFAAPYQVDTRLPEEMGSITAARQRAREVLAECGYLGRREDVLLVVSELVTNALVHGDGPPALRIRCTPSHVRIEVRDRGARLPEPREPGPDNGWGLHVIELLSTGWGVSRADEADEGDQADEGGEAGESGEGGKVVWCELAPHVVAPAQERSRA